jgi:hypothetical protein
LLERLLVVRLVEHVFKEHEAESRALVRESQDAFARCDGRTVKHCEEMVLLVEDRLLAILDVV